MKIERFLSGIEYLSDVFKLTTFTREKVNSAAKVLLNNIQSKKQVSTTILRSLYDEIYFNNKSNIHHCNFIRQQEVLRNVLRVNEDQPEQILRYL